MDARCVPDRVDVAVVGGGVVGLATAAFLASHGSTVAVFERAQCGVGASTHNAGQIRPGACVPLASPGALAEVRRSGFRPGRSIRIGAGALAHLRWLAAFAAWSGGSRLADRTSALAELGTASEEAFAILERWFGSTILKRRGALDLYETDRAWREAAQQAVDLARYGFTAEAVSASEARIKEPSLSASVIGGVWFEAAAHCDPDALIAALIKIAEKLGAQVVPETEVKGLFDDGKAEWLTTPDRVVRADSVVLATGCDGRLPRARDYGHVLPVIAGRGYGIDLKLAKPLEHPLIFAERHVAATPLHGTQTRLTTGMEIGNSRSNLSRGRRRRLIRSARSVLEGIAATPASTGWTGDRPMTPDGLPLIGRLPGRNRIIVATGHGMLGVTHAAGTGALIADLLDGHRPGWAAAFDPGRFLARWRPGGGR